MVETNGRQYVQPILDAIAHSRHRAGIGTNVLTFAGMTFSGDANRAVDTPSGNPHAGRNGHSEG